MNAKKIPLLLKRSKHYYLENKKNWLFFFFAIQQSGLILKVPL